MQRPVQILGNLDGIETGIRQLIRTQPLETARLRIGDLEVTLPTLAEILRLKAALILKRNATRDYPDFVALADQLGDEAVVAALASFDELYPQPNGASATQQLQIQLANPLPYGLDQMNLAEYKNLDPRWHDWAHVKEVAATIGVLLLDRLP